MCQLLRKIHIGFVSACTLAVHCVALPVATDNPVARYKLKWTDEIKWANVVVITEYRRSTLEERFDKAQRAVAAKGGGVVYFPPGLYWFKDSLHLRM